MCFIVVITFQALAAAGSDMVGFSLLIHSNIFLSTCSFRTVLLVKYKLKALLFRVLIYGELREFIWHDSLSSTGPITVSVKKIQPSNELVCIICMCASYWFFFLSQHVRDVKNSSQDNKINKPLWPLLIPLEKGNKGSGDEAGRKGEENTKASRNLFLWCRYIFQFGVIFMCMPN